MYGKNGLGPAGDREMRAFKFSPLTVLAWVFCVHFGGFYRLRAECALMHDTCVLQYLRSDSA